MRALAAALVLCVTACAQPKPPPCDNPHIDCISAVRVYHEDVPTLQGDWGGSIREGGPDFNLAVSSSIDYVPASGDLYRRVERWSVHRDLDTKTYTGTTLAQALAAFAKDHEAKP